MSQQITAECPDCGYAVDDASAVQDGQIDMEQNLRPKPGDLALCIRCAAPGFYFEKEDGTLGLRAPTFNEKVQLSQEREVMKARTAIIAMNELHRPFEAGS